MTYFNEPDVSAWPIIFCRLRGDATVDGFKEYETWLQACVDRGRAEQVRIVVISEASEAGSADAEVRKYLGEWSERAGEANKDVVALSVIVMTSRIARGVMKAIGWFSPTVAATKTVESVAEAWGVALAKLAAEGRAPPAKQRPLWLTSSQ